MLEAHSNRGNPRIKAPRKAFGLMGNDRGSGMTPPGKIRVIGGMFRGRRLGTLPGKTVRPTGDRVREALFDLIGRRIQGCTFLDAYAGTGAVGIEALSRGAAAVTFVEKDAAALGVLRENLERILGPSCRDTPVRVLPVDLLDAIRDLERRHRAFDILFLDPPYGGGELDRALRLLSRSDLTGSDSMIVAEHAAGDPRPESGSLEPIRTEVYGKVALTFLMRATV